ncbi:hypothetical protein Pelo_675 [Pelomyxa schiedti]|nr:hypothetical protein Pelo_675 [Pelomyxa schiedti]
MKTTKHGGPETGYKQPTAAKHRRTQRDNDDAIVGLPIPGGLDVVLPPGVLDVIVGMLMWPPHPSHNNHSNSQEQYTVFPAEQFTVVYSNPEPDYEYEIHSGYTSPSFSPRIGTGRNEGTRNEDEEAFKGIRCLFQFALCSRRCLEACERVSLLIEVRGVFSRAIGKERARNEQDFSSMNRADSSSCAVGSTPRWSDSEISVSLLERQLAERNALLAFAKVAVAQKRWELQVASSKPAEMAKVLGEIEEVATQRLVAFNSRLQFVGHNSVEKRRSTQCCGVVSFVTWDCSKKVFLFSTGCRSSFQCRVQIGFCVVNRGSPAPQPPPPKVLKITHPSSPWIPLAEFKIHTGWTTWLTTEVTATTTPTYSPDVQAE